MRRLRSKSLGPLAAQFRRMPLDVVTLATAFVALLFVVPARIVLTGTGAAGRPALLVATLIGFFWCVERLRSQPPRAHRSLVGAALSLYLAAQVLAWAGGHARGLIPQEASGSDRWLVVTLALSGLAFAVAHGVPDLARLRVLLQRLVYGAVFMALTGALQFLVHVDITPFLRLPGLSPNRTLIGVSSRGGPEFARVAGTATHYIEYGVVLAVVLPLALHFAMTAKTRRDRIVHRSCAAIIAFCVPFSISRSAVVALAVAMLVLMWGWPWRTKVRAAALSVMAVVTYRAVQPGLLGTIKALFTHANDDPSVAGRTDDYGYVMQMVSERPLLGRGPGTFQPDLYILLDNQLLETLVSSGLVGLGALLLVVLAGYGSGRSVRLRARDEQDRHLGQALAASILALLVAAATFDALTFATFSGVLFLLLGAVGALHRLALVHPQQPIRPAEPGSVLVNDPLMARKQRVR